MKKDILYINSVEDIRLIDTLRISNKDKELPNLIILTILSAGAGVVTPIFSKDASGTTIFSSIDEIGTKFILDGKEVTSDDFLVVTKSQYGTNYNFFGLLFEDSNEHILKISLVNSTVPNFQNPGFDCSANSITSVIIGNSITGIDSSAFSGCAILTSVSIPNSVTSIGHFAFSKCSHLISVNIPKLITSIDTNTFSGCSSLTTITIPNSVTTIGTGSFSGCTNLTSVIIPNSVTLIDNNAFTSCTGLTSITIPDSVTEIGQHAFDSCSSLTSITSLATTAPTISNNTFQNIKSEGTLHVPAGSDYSTWMSTDNYYLGLYNWTKVEDVQ